MRAQQFFLLALLHIVFALDLVSKYQFAGPFAGSKIVRQCQQQFLFFNVAKPASNLFVLAKMDLKNMTIVSNGTLPFYSALSAEFAMDAACRYMYMGMQTKWPQTELLKIDTETWQIIGRAVLGNYTSVSVVALSQDEKTVYAVSSLANVATVNAETMQLIRYEYSNILYDIRPYDGVFNEEQSVLYGSFLLRASYLYSLPVNNVTSAYEIPILGDANEVNGNVLRNGSKMYVPVYVSNSRGKVQLFDMNTKQFEMPNLSFTSSRGVSSCSIAIDPTKTYLYILNRGQLYKILPSNDWQVIASNTITNSDSYVLYLYNGLGFAVGNFNIYVFDNIECSNQQLKINQTCFFCSNGTYLQQDGYCATCATGSYATPTSKSCALCPENYYAPIEGASSCLYCNPATHKADLQHGATACNELPVPYSWKLLIIIAGCAIGGVALLLVAVIVIIAAIIIKRSSRKSDEHQQLIK